MNTIMRKNWLALASMGAMAIVINGCTPSPSGGDTTTGGTASTTGSPTASTDNGKPIELAFVTNNVSDYWTIARKGTEKAMQETPGLKVDFVMPPGGTAAEQTQLVNDNVSKGVAGIAISPKDPANETQLINDTVKKGVLVFTQDSDAPKSDRACYVGTDNVAAGKQLGDEIKKALPNGGKLMAFVGAIDAQNAKDRYDGILESLKGSKCEIIDVKTDNTDRARAKANVQEALVAHPDLVGLIGLWSYNGPSIYSAVKDANKIGQVKILCFDDEADTIAGLKNGAITATIVQQPFVFGEQACVMMAKYLKGDKSAIPANKLDIIPTNVINKDSVDKYVADQAKLLGK